MATPPFDLAQAQRWLAVEFNNTTWDLLDKPDRTRDENEAMVHSAHATFVHWKKAGTEIHQLRSYNLLTYVYSAVGNETAAIVYGKRALEFLERQPEGVADWDSAFIYDSLSRAYRVAGNNEEADSYRTKAEEAGDRIADEEDKAMYVAMKDRP